MGMTTLRWSKHNILFLLHAYYFVTQHQAYCTSHCVRIKIYIYINSRLMDDTHYLTDLGTNSLFCNWFSGVNRELQVLNVSGFIKFKSKHQSFSQADHI